MARPELIVAGDADEHMIPFRIGNVLPKKGLRVRLMDLHWIDGFIKRDIAIEHGRFPPPELLGFRGTTSLSVTPTRARPLPRGRPVGPVIPNLTTLWGFPCCVRFPCVRAAASTPVQRLGVVFAHLAQPYQPSPKLQSGRPAHRPFRSLLGVHSRCGPHTRAVTYM